MKSFEERLGEDRPILYDGGFGSQLFVRGVELTNSTLANESHPEAVTDIHMAYIDAGSEAIGTNTFVASALHLDMAGKEGEEADEIARLGVRNAKAAVEQSGKDVYVGGSMGPSPGAIEADAGDTTFGIPNDKVRDGHRRLAAALAGEGIDFFVVETQFSANEAAIAVDEARKHGLPILVSMTYKYTKDRKSGEIIYKTDWGHSPADMLDALASGEHSDGEDLIPYVNGMGLNCGAETRESNHTGMQYAIEGTAQLASALKDRNLSAKLLVAYPNAGMPKLNKAMETVYSQSPEDMSGYVDELRGVGAGFLGGCCGTDPEHIAAFRKAIDANA
jgi:methionine synthase I (cobalamin-dependent)